MADTLVKYPLNWAILGGDNHHSWIWRLRCAMRQEQNRVKSFAYLHLQGVIIVNENCYEKKGDIPCEKKSNTDHGGND